MSIKTLTDIEKKRQDFINQAKADTIKIEIPELKEERTLKGFRLPQKLVEDLKILSAKTRKDQSRLVIEALELLFAKYYQK